jgi:hypothetical protein
MESSVVLSSFVFAEKALEFPWKESAFAKKKRKPEKGKKRRA